MTLKEAIMAYQEKFGEGPPIFGMSENEALDEIQRALESGTLITTGAEKDIDDDALL